jgi:hypothetical protein
MARQKIIKIIIESRCKLNRDLLFALLLKTESGLWRRMADKYCQLLKTARAPGNRHQWRITSARARPSDGGAMFAEVAAWLMKQET